MERKVVVLLGAGASKDAGLPTMVELVEDFEEEVDGPKGEALDAITTRLVEHTGKSDAKVDLELLLETLIRLRDRRQDVLSAFVHDKGWRADAARYDEHYSPLLLDLNSHLRKSLDLDPPKTGYLRPLIDFAVAEGGVDLFTLNYDLGVEIAAERAGIQITDGFDVGWNPALLDDVDRFTIRLHKLHGSLLWYRTGQGASLTKVPLRPGAFPSDTAHYLGQPLTELMVYPGPNKALFEEPYVELLERFRARLREAHLLVVIGCSLRDVHVRRAILEAMVQSDQLALVVVDPGAGGVIRASDRLVGGTLRFANFTDRIVLCTETTAAALREKRLIQVAARTRDLDDSLEDYWQFRRKTHGLATSKRLARVLRQAAGMGRWGLVWQLLEKEPAGLLLEAAKELPKSVAGDPRFWIEVLAAMSSQRDVRMSGRDRVRRAMCDLLQGAWHPDRTLICPDGTHPSSVAPSTAGVVDWNRHRTETMDEALDGLTARVAESAGTVPSGVPVDTVVERCRQQVTAVLAYFGTFGSSYRSHSIGGAMIPGGSHRDIEECSWALRPGVGNYWEGIR